MSTKKQGVPCFDNAAPDAAATWDELNRVFRGSVVFVKVGVPAEMMIDDRHLTASGSAALAGVLHELTREAFAPADAVH